ILFGSSFPWQNSGSGRLLYIGSQPFHPFPFPLPNPPHRLASRARRRGVRTPRPRHHRSVAPANDHAFPVGERVGRERTGQDARVQADVVVVGGGAGAVGAAVRRGGGCRGGAPGDGDAADGGGRGVRGAGARDGRRRRRAPRRALQRHLCPRLRALQQPRDGLQVRRDGVRHQGERSHRCRQVVPHAERHPRQGHPERLREEAGKPLPEPAQGPSRTRPHQGPLRAIPRHRGFIV
ncbi:hypothetical protein ZEAMMB73_Zm00001d013445, partial [Zea mays]